MNRLIKPFTIHLEKNVVPSYNSVQKILKQKGHVLFKNANFKTAKEMSERYGHLAGTRMTYKMGTNNRVNIGDGVLNVGTEPHYYYVNQHNEMSYTDEWPSVFLLACITPSETGGITPICNNRQLTNDLPIELTYKSLQKGIKYYRFFTNKYDNDGIVYNHWQDLFKTDDKSVVEKELIENSMDFKWNSDDSLSMSYTRPAFIKHPETEEMFFFNAGFQNFVWFDCWKPYNELPMEKRPFSASWGDGEPFTREEAEALENNAEKNIIGQKWEQGDIMILDNHHYTHGRLPYEENSKRQIGVIMGNRVSRGETNQGISSSMYDYLE